MTLIQKILAIASLWAAAKGHTSTSRLSTVVANDGKALGRLEVRGSATVATLDKFRTFLGDPNNWPGKLIPAPAQQLLDDIGHISTVPAAPESALQ